MLILLKGSSMHLQTSLLMILFFLTGSSAWAQVINAEDAKETAISFLTSKKTSSSRREVQQINSSLSEAITLCDEGEPAVHIFNRSNGGFIIVSGEMGTLHQILAYSDAGYYDPNNITVQMKEVIDGYISDISRLRKATVDERRRVERNIAMDRITSTARTNHIFGMPDHVNPLLGDIAWGQDSPYNLMTPTYIGEKDLEHYPTGCVVTAVAQIMKYHEWPKQGRGNHSYEWNNQTLSADFSNSYYDWDLMSPIYDNDHTYSDVQKNAVALLMHDVGIAMEADYDMSGSGASIHHPNMVKYFDYDKNMRTLNHYNCTQEEFDGELRSELVEGRPVLCTGRSQGGAGHAFVCDGYNSDGLFHYNFGWDGFNNGWFASSATGWDSEHEISYGIERNKGGKGAPSLISKKDFMWDAISGCLSGDLNIECVGLDFEWKAVTIDFGLAIKNVVTNEVSYYIDWTCNYPRGRADKIDFNDYIPDGKYYVYPVGRVNDEEWHTFFHNPILQNVVDLTVKNGVKTWENNNLVDDIDEDVIEIDNIFYTIDKYNKEAAVVMKNERGNCYIGDVTIPDFITHDGETYPVTSIDFAFQYCNHLNSVHIGKNVQSISNYAFWESSVANITFAEESNLQWIGGYAFYYCENLKEIIIPEGVETIGSYAFFNCYLLNKVVFPCTLKNIGYDIFAYITELQELHVNWASLDNVNIDDEAFKTCNIGESLLFVPKGFVDMYKSTAPWSSFGKIVEEEYEPIEHKWTFDKTTGTLYVQGEGAMQFSAKDGIWDEFKDDIKHVVVAKGITSLPSGAFYECLYLESVQLPSTLKSIGNNAFYRCSKLEDMVIPEGVESIGSTAFAYTKFEEITFPSTLKDIYWYAFFGADICHLHVNWSSLDNVYIDDDAFENCNIDESLLFVPKGFVDMYKSTAPWSGFGKIVEEGYVPKEKKWTFDETTGTLYVEGEGKVQYSVLYGGEWIDFDQDIKHVVIGEGITSLRNDALKGCDNIVSISLPSTFKYINDLTFAYCIQLKEIIIPEGVERIGSYAFADCWGLTSVTIPNSVTSIDDAFKGCTELSTIISEIRIPFPLNKNTFDSSLYNSATLYVPPYSIELYQATDGWKKFKNIVPIKDYTYGKTITISVNDSKKQDITNQVSIFWYDADGKQIGSGNSLKGIEEGDTLYYSVLLGEELGREYREVIMQQLFVDPDVESLTCTLIEISRIELAGRVSATDIDKNTVTVTINQMLNGKYEQTFTTQTDEQGLFSIEVYDDVTDISLNGETYFDVTLHRDGFGGNANMGVIPMNLLSGFAIAADISLKKAVAAGASEDIAELTGGLNNIEFSLYDATKGKALTDFSVQNGNLIIKSDASIGDEIRLMAKSKQDIFAEATTTFTIKEGANSFALELTELGGIDVTYAASNNGKTIGYLYDTNNALVAKGSYVGDNLSLRHLPSGNYMLVTMGNSALFGNLTNLSDLNTIGLNEGSDYITTSIAVTDGVLSASSISEVPRMDDTRFYYTSDNAYFSANKATVTVGNYIALAAHVDLKPQYQDKVDDVLVTIELPEGCLLAENSVIANRQTVAHTYSGNKLMMNLSQEQWQGEIRFCVIPVLNQTYAITAMASFDIDGGVTQPIGTAQFESKGLSLNTPSQTADTNITINGTAKGKSEVSIYDNDVLIGKTTSKADGTWTTTCELYKTYSHSFHNIYAKITNENGLELTSETKQVEYDKDKIVPKTVTMLYYNPEFSKDYNIVFDLVNGTSTPSSYYYFPYKNWPNWYETRETEPKNFTFLADFTKNDSTLIENVNIKVLNSDGTVRTLPATFDGKQGKWVATTKYSSSKRLPQNVTVEYDYIPQEESDDWREESLLDQATVLANCANQIQQFFEDKESTVIEDENDHLTIEYMFDETTPVRMRIENMDYADAERMMKEVQFIYSKSDEGIFGTYTEETDNEVLVVAVNIDQNTALRMKMFLSSENAKNRLKKVSYTGGGNIAIVSLLAGTGLDLLGIKPYLDVTSDFDHMRNIIVKYTDCYNSIRQRITKKMLAKCPDGSYKLENSSQRESFNREMRDISDQEDDFRNKYYEYLRSYQNCLRNSLLTDLVTFGIGKRIETLIKGSKFITDASESAFLYFALEKKTLVHPDAFASAFTFSLSAPANTIINATTNIFDYKNFEKVRDNMLEYAYKENSDILKKYNELMSKIEEAYKKCKKDDDDEPSDDDDDYPGPGSSPIIDPSGYVYEAVLSNRLEGVTATCYQKVQTEDMYGDITDEAVIWNAEDYSQQNPVKTDKDGFYRWDVPQGMWQVKYEKEGYETVYSGWLPVPPPQLDVNIAMKQSTPPMVKQMRGTESGITVDMTKYMLPATMTIDHITVTRNGKAEQGTIEMLNAEQAPLSGETYVQKIKFVPNSRFRVTDDVVVTVHKEVESYCRVPMSADHQEMVEIESEITDIVVDATVTVPYQGERELRVLVLPKEASAGRKLHVQTSSSMIASLSASDIIIEEDGSATFTVSGELPGSVVLDFGIDGTDLTVSSKIQVKNMGDMVATPVASLPNGEVVAKGTKVELSCETEGATIYYTLDGSCPCDEANRILYTEPITVNGNIVINAIAVLPGLYDSDVTEYRYILTDEEVHVSDITLDDAIDIYPLPMRDRINVRVKDKTIDRIIITNTEGKVMAHSSKSSSIVTLDVHALPSGIYIITATTDGKEYSRKVVKVQ